MKDRPGSSENTSNALDLNIDDEEQESSSYDERLTIRGTDLYGTDGPPSQDALSLICPLCGDPQQGTSRMSLAQELLEHLMKVHDLEVKKVVSREPLLES